MQIVMSGYPAKPSLGNPGLFSVVFNLDGTPDPMPRKVIEVKNAAAALDAFAAYVEEAKATGQLIACSLRAGEGRKAPGFDKARATLPPYTIVNGGQQ
jgi:hypothetical protein